MRNTILNKALICLTIFLTSNSNLLASNNFIHRAKIASGAKIGNKRDIGIFKTLIPVWQSGNAKKLAYLDLRTRLDDVGSSEFNLGGGYRFVMDKDFLNQKEWIIGAYGFIDRLDSRFNNVFLQTTLGIEALSESYDFRLNVYLPQDKEKDVNQLREVSFNGHGFEIINQKEKPLDGFDVEFGYKLPINKFDAHLFVGAYYYDANQFDTIAGPRVRSKVSVDNNHLSIIPNNTAISLGGEFQNDSINGEQFFATASVTYSFGGDVQTAKSDLRSRMTEFAYRDIDIISDLEDQSQLATIFFEGQEFAEVLIVNASDDYENIISNNKDSGILIILDNSQGSFSPSNVITLNENQYLTSDAMLQIKSMDQSLKIDYKLDVDRAEFIAYDNQLLFELNNSNHISYFNVINEVGDDFIARSSDKNLFTTNNSIVPEFANNIGLINFDGKNDVTIKGINFTTIGNMDQNHAISANQSNGVNLVDNNFAGYKNGVVGFNNANITISGNKFADSTTDNVHDMIFLYYEFGRRGYDEISIDAQDGINFRYSLDHRLTTGSYPRDSVAIDYLF